MSRCVQTFDWQWSLKSHLCFLQIKSNQIQSAVFFFPPQLISTYYHYFCPRVPGLSSSGSSAAPPAAAATPAANPEPSSLNWAAAAGDGARLSSDEGDGEPTEDSDTPACHYSDRHPQPAGVNKPSGSCRHSSE